MDEFKEALHKAIRHLEKATQELIRVGSEGKNYVPRNAAILVELANKELELLIKKTGGQ